MNKDVRKWEQMRDAMVLAMHEMMLSNPETKEKYFKLYQNNISQYRQLEGDIFLNGQFPFGFDALQVDDEDESPDE